MSINKKFAIRVDADSKIGLGHLMRCMEIAKELKRRSIEVLFITYLNSQTEIIKEKGFELCDLSEWQFQNEEDIIKSILKENEIANIIIDRYDLGFDYFFEIKKIAKKLIYLDDLNEYDYPVDVIVNGNITALYMKYNKYFNHAKLLLGPEYYILRQEFIELESRFKARIGRKKKVLITTGGSDYKNFSLKLIEMISDYTFFGELEVDIVVGPGFRKETREALISFSKGYKNIRIFIEPENMAEIILNNDIVITAGGGTLYEALFLKKDIIAFIYAKNQENIVGIMSEEGLIDSIGWYYNDINELLKKNIYDLYRGNKCSKKNEKFSLSKYGANNIVEKILKS